MEKEAIAIVGIGCRFPGAKNKEAFWHLIRDGIDAITEVPPTRWDLKEYYDQDSTKANKINTRWGGFLENIDCFDAQFFNIIPREATTIDPQQRLLLETAYETLEDAGQVLDTLRGTKTGVFIGIGTHDYSIMMWQQPVNEPYATTGTGNCIAANRISYTFDFKGPSMAIETACSSSLVALHLACQSIWGGESAMALAGGVNVLLSPTVMVGFSKGGFMANDGRCKSFDAKADGYVRSEGVGLVLLKPLSQAQREGDFIYGVIRNSAVNQDGYTNGLAVPNLKAQKSLITDVYDAVSINPSQVQYVEAHGTGTVIGDTTELQSLGEVFGEKREDNDYCIVGSVKTNIGHTETAAGIAGVIKVALMLSYKKIPPNLHFKQPNPKINFEELKLVIPTKLRSFNSDRKFIAGINSFGFGGTNAHLILEEVPNFSEQDSDLLSSQNAHLFTLSAKSELALQELTQSYQIFLKNNQNLCLSDICYTLAIKRNHYNYRLSCVTHSYEELDKQLNAFINKKNFKRLTISHINRNSSPKIAFAFTGQGSQYLDMGYELYQTQPLFRQIIDQCSKILQKIQKANGKSKTWNLVKIIHSNLSTNKILVENKDLNGVNKKNSEKLNQTKYTQPALFVVEYALAKLWMSWGIQPNIMIGHSIGEYVAACLAGVFSLEDALKLVEARGRLMQELAPKGSMLAVFTSVDKLKQIIKPFKDVNIAAINSAENVVISGKNVVLKKLELILDKLEIRSQFLDVSHPFHSPLLNPILNNFREIAEKINYAEAKIPLISNVSGKMANSQIATANYWVNHIINTVQFAEGFKLLLAEKIDIVLEIGTKPILLGLGKSILSSNLDILIKDSPPLFLPSLRRKQEDLEVMFNSLAQFYHQGIKINWPKVESQKQSLAYKLPTYPFQGQKFWWEGAKLSTNNNQSQENLWHPLLGIRLFLANSSEIIFENKISHSSPIYLQSHCLEETVVFPATAYLEIALAAGKYIYKTNNLQIEEFKIKNPLLLPENTSIKIQTKLTKNDDYYKLEIFSCSLETESIFILHADLLVKTKTELSLISEVNLEDLQRKLLNHNLDVSKYYQQLSSQGLNYGVNFQGIKTFSFEEGKAFGYIQLPLNLISESQSYLLHPVLLDSCFQLIGAACGDIFSEGVYLPIGIESLDFQENSSNSIWLFLEVSQNANHQTLTANLHLFNESGLVFAKITGLSLQYLNRKSLQKLIQSEIKEKISENDCLYGIAWQEKSLGYSLNEQNLEIPQKWLIFADKVGIGETLASILSNQTVNNQNIVILWGDEFKVIDSQHYQINARQPQDFQQLMKAISENDSDNLLNWGIIHLWCFDFVNMIPTINDIETFHQEICGSILYLIQSLPTQVTQFWLTTYQSQAVVASPQTLQNAIWGFARVINLEYPNLNCFCLDLDTLNVDMAVNILKEEIKKASKEKQIAYYNNHRYVPRLVLQKSSLSLQNEDVFDCVRLQISEYGNLDNLKLTPLKRRSPKRGEVEIQVLASGVNFRDVLNALGMLKDFLAQMGFNEAYKVPFGGECAGIITAMGEGVSNFKIGDEVIAAQAVGSLSSFVNVKAEFVALKPTSLSFNEAATIPITFLTAYYGLHYLTKIKAGDRILIHSAAGGVGQAAIQLAQQAGAEIFATASPPKWDFLQASGVKQIMNSRNLDFAQEIMTLTNGEGVDLILNCFNGDFIPKSLEVMGKGGRFIEIGKIGIWNQSQVTQFRDDISYFPFDLLEVSNENPQLITDLLTKLMIEFNQGNLKPLNHKVFSINQASNAFRYLAQAQHIGKVVISLPSVIKNQNQYSSSLQNNNNSLINLDLDQRNLVIKEGSYLITGGYGALGLQVATWLGKQGAKHLILVGRNQPSVSANLVISKLQDSGIKIDQKLADITNEIEINSIVAEFKTSLRGVIHTAGIINDGLLANFSWQDFQSVLSAKINGTWLLHQATQKLSLDWFVCFSSITSVLGAQAQANYACANAFMDNLMQYRQGFGLPGVSINWSLWEGEGMATQLTSQLQQRLLNQGLTALNIKENFAILPQLLRENNPQVIVLKVDWSIFGQKSPRSANNPFFECLINSSELPSFNQSKSWLTQLAKQSPQDRYTILHDYLREQLARVLGFERPEDIDTQENFADLGMDSLMAVEFKNSLETTFDNAIPLSLTFDYPTVELLTEYIGRELLNDNFLSKILEQFSQELTPEDFDENLTKKIKNTSEKIDQELLLNNNLTLKADINNVEIKPYFYQFSLTPEYLSLKEDLKLVNQLGNPFFIVHKGISQDTKIIGDRQLINYSSYNYLGMSGNATIIKATQEAIANYGTSVSASRVLGGEIPLHQELEREIAKFLGTEDSIVYVGGHSTNVSTIGHLFGENDLIVCDALSHNSIQKGCQLSGATIIQFLHNNWQDLEQILAQKRNQYEKVLIAIEGIYSTDGDIAPLPQIVQLKKHYKTFLLVDEAHSIGVLGISGRGIREHFNLQSKDVDLWMGTLSKSFASCGGYIAGCRELIEYLKYTSPGFVFSVGMSPANTAAALASLRLLEKEPERVSNLQKRAKFCLDLAKSHQLNTGFSQDSPIIPIIIGEPQKAVILAKLLAEKGIDVNPMVYPSVPYNQARLRFFITCLHTEKQITFTLNTLTQIINQ